MRACTLVACEYKRGTGRGGIRVTRIVMHTWLMLGGFCIPGPIVQCLM